MLKSLINFIILTFGFGNILQTIIYNFTIFIKSKKDIELIISNDWISFIIRFIIFYQNIGMIISAMTFISWTVKKDPFFKMVSIQMIYNLSLTIITSYLFFSTTQIQKGLLLTDNQKTLVSDCIFVSGMHVIAATIILYFKKELVRLFFTNEKEPVDHLFRNLILCTHLVTKEDNCSICLEDKYNTVIGILQCGHSFHSQCILDWIRNNVDNEIDSHCPLCRELIE